MHVMGPLSGPGNYVRGNDHGIKPYLGQRLKAKDWCLNGERMNLQNITR